MKYLFIILTLLLPGAVLSHGGELDRYGCHHDNQQKTYHCHQGELTGQSFSSKAQMLGGLQINKLEAAVNYYRGKVISVTDGDTIKILVDSRQIKVRLAEIDAPEKSQDYGMKSKQFLGNLVFGKVVRVKEVDWDRYGRMVGRVYLDKVDVNAEIVRNGYAWAYRKYLTDQTILSLETEARNNRRGLWASDVRMPPWEWRRGKR